MKEFISKENFFLKKHEQFLKNGLPKRNGLCTEFGELNLESVPKKYQQVFELFEPTTEDITRLEDDRTSTSYWGDEVARNKEGEDLSWTNERSGAYTTLRQTIVLFCHEILNS